MKYFNGNNSGVYVMRKWRKKLQEIQFYRVSFGMICFFIALIAVIKDPAICGLK